MGERRIGSVEVLAAVLVLGVLSRGAEAFQAPIVQTWAAMFVSRDLLVRVLPRRPVLAVPAAAVAGVVLPGCECGSVPVAGALLRKGIAPSVALTPPRSVSNTISA